MGRPAAEPYVEAELPSAIDSSLTDDGRWVMTMFTQYGPPDEEAWEGDARERYADACVEHLARYAPNVPDAILEREVLAPPDLERIFGLQGGNIFQGEQGLDQMAFMRPIAGPLPVRDARARALPVRRRHPPGRRGDGRRRATTPPAASSATGGSGACAAGSAATPPPPEPRRQPEGRPAAERISSPAVTSSDATNRRLRRRRRRMSAPRVAIRRPAAADEPGFLAAVEASREMHGDWIAPPATPDAFAAYLRRLERPTHEGFVITAGGELAGWATISEIVRARLQSGFLGFAAFSGFAGRGLVRAGLALVLTEAFTTLGLHRLEASVQPANSRSAATVTALGFRLEGHSPRYLWIDEAGATTTATRSPPRSGGRSARPPPPRRPDRVARRGWASTTTSRSEPPARAVGTAGSPRAGRLPAARSAAT